MDRELDDEIAAASENRSRDMLITILERERKTLDEIELALARIKKGDYGTCRSCGTRIPDARLSALALGALLRAFRGRWVGHPATDD